MNDNVEFLNYIYQNTSMGVNTITQLIKLLDNKDQNSDKAFIAELNYELKEYQYIQSSAKELLSKEGKTEKDLSSFDKVKTYIMLNLSLLTDKSIKHIAESMIQGSTMGIVECTKNIQHYDCVDKDVKYLADKLIHFEQNSIDKLKTFL
ncbi:MAG: hypothetical protein ACRCZK_06260 [Oscillospiraceae bacterium]